MPTPWPNPEPVNVNKAGAVEATAGVINNGAASENIKKVARLRTLDILIGGSALSDIHELLIFGDYFGRFTASHDFAFIDPDNLITNILDCR
jgi:hypothetical protein